MTDDQKQRPLISVIIPTFNSVSYISEAVNSVLSQTYSPVELIVINDGSTDSTREILASIQAPFQYIYQANGGTGAARNAGVEASSGDFLAFLDSDDIWLSDKLQRQMEVFEQNPETDVVYGQAMQFCSPELNDQERARLEHVTGRAQPAPIAPAMLIRRRAFEQVGAFDVSLRIGVEMEWYGRLCDLSLNMIMLDDVIYKRRLHRTNTNRIHYDEQPERLIVLKNLLDRRRALAAREQLDENAPAEPR